MGVYSRFKKNPFGFRSLVELLETTPQSRRQKMIAVGMAEDKNYTEKALQYIIHFDDIVSLQDAELMELLNDAPPRLVAYAIHSSGKQVQQRFIERSPPRLGAEIKDFLDTPNVTVSQISGGQIKLIEMMRKLEKRGIIKTKRIPE